MPLVVTKKWDTYFGHFWGNLTIHAQIVSLRRYQDGRGDEGIGIGRPIWQNTLFVTIDVSNSIFELAEFRFKNIVPLENYSAASKL